MISSNRGEHSISINFLKINLEFKRNFNKFMGLSLVVTTHLPTKKLGKYTKFNLQLFPY